MLLDILAIAAGCALLYYGGDRLLDGAIRLGRAFGWSAAVIGLLVVSLGTSAPELFVSAGSALQGYGDIAAGNVIGSNTVNIALVLGLAAVIAVLPVDAMLRRVQFPIMLASSALAVLLLLDNRFDRLDGFIVFSLVMLSTALAFRGRAAVDVAIVDGQDAASPRTFVDLLIGATLLVVGAELLILGAVALSRDLGVPEAVVALTVTAVGTSLPEISATVLAVSRRQTDLAIGNVVGSNIMNVGLVLGISGMLAPFASLGVSRFSLFSMLVFCMLAMSMALLTGRFSRWFGALLLTAYAVYLVLLFS